MSFWKRLFGAANTVPKGSTEATEPPRDAASSQPITPPPKSSMSGQEPHLDSVVVQATLRVKAVREAYPDRFPAKGTTAKRLCTRRRLGTTRAWRNCCASTVVTNRPH